MEDRGNDSVLHFLFNMDVGMSGQTGGCRSTHGTVIQSPGMGGLAHAGPPAADCSDSGRRGSLAAIRPFACLTAVFPPDRNFVDHHWNIAPDPGATVAGGDLAVRIAGVLRRGDDQRDRVY